MPNEILTGCAQADREFNRRLEQGAAAAPSDRTGKHLETCARCRALYAEFAPVESAFDETVNARISARLRESLRPVRPVRSLPASALWFLALFIALAVSMVAWMGTAGMRQWSPAQFLIIFIIVVSGALLCSFALARQNAPAARRFLPAGPLIGIFGAGALFGILLVFPWRTQGTSAFVSWQCMPRELLIAAPAGLFFWLILRRAAVLSATTRGASAGAMAGMIAVTVFQFSCPYQNGLHLLFWHWSVLAITTAGGALLGAPARDILHDRP